MASLMNLPNELLFEISEYLDVRGIAGLIRTAPLFDTILKQRFRNLSRTTDCALKALFYAAEHDSMIIFNIFIKRYNASPTLCSIDGTTPVHVAAQHGNFMLLNALIYYGFDANACTRDGTTPLHLALTPKVAKALIIAGAGPHARDSKKQTPLHTAAKSGRTETMNVLIAAGADVNATCKDPQNNVDGGYTPLHGASDNGQDAAVTILIKRGANIDAKIETCEWTPLGCASSEGHASTVNLLLQVGAAVDFQHEPPLLLAINGNCSERVLTLLLKHGANVETALAGIAEDDTRVKLTEFFRDWRDGKKRFVRFKNNDGEERYIHSNTDFECCRRGPRNIDDILLGQQHSLCRSL